MFEIGFWELLLVFVVALIVVGPERLPELARTLGLWVNKARRIVTEVRSEVERELRIDEIKHSMESTSSPLSEIRQLADRVKAINTDLKADVLGDISSNTSNTATPTTPATPPPVTPAMPATPPAAQSPAESAYPVDPPPK